MDLLSACGGVLGLVFDDFFEAGVGEGDLGSSRFRFRWCWSDSLPCSLWVKKYGYKITEINRYSIGVLIHITTLDQAGDNFCYH